VSPRPDTIGPLVEAAQALVNAVQSAEVAAAFTEGGAGPFDGLCDGWGPFRGPIRSNANRLREALLDHERAWLTEYARAGQ
jgi:hypothetical protein